MTSTYIAIEHRIQKAINALNTRQNPSQTEIAREFNVPLQRLRSRLAGHPPASAVRGLHNRKLKPDQDLALHTYIKRLDELGLPVRLNMIQSTANALIRQDYPRWAYPPPLNAQWTKRWLDRQSDLHKAKRKPLTAAQKNAHNLKLLQGHFDAYHELVQRYDITKNDTWNFDETGYRMGIARSD
jgi:hypothetical protein